MKTIAFLLIVFTFIHCSSDSSDSSNSSDPSVENNTSNQEPIAYSCEDVQEALNKVYLFTQKLRLVHCHHQEL